MGYKDRSTSDEVLLLTNLCRHHEQTIAQMFNVQEPILRYAKALHFAHNNASLFDWSSVNVFDDESDLLYMIEYEMEKWEEHNGTYRVNWEEA